MGFAFQVMSKKRNKGPDDGTASDVWYELQYHAYYTTSIILIIIIPSSTV